MIDFFKWISNLKPQDAWVLFACVALLLAIMPYFGIIFKAIKVLLVNEKPTIIDFSWRLIPDAKIARSDTGKDYYISGNDGVILYEGMVVLLNWNVKGAFRVDLLPIGKNLTGNTTKIIIRSTQTKFLLVAYTWTGKLTRELVINKGEILKINTFNISRETNFEQPATSLETSNLSESQYMGMLFFRQSISNLKRVLTLGLKVLESQNILKSYQFDPASYNEALNNYMTNLNTKNK